MARLYGEKEDIDSKTVKNFFNKRAKIDRENLMTITSYHDSDNMDKRQEEDIHILSEKIDFKEKKLLEIGCGLGRWAEFFHDKCETYVGIDYSENLIKIAKENYNYPNCYFVEMSIDELENEKLPISAPFDIVIITGVLLYLNDEDIKVMIDKINKLTGLPAIIYIRDTISVLDTRLTLKDFYSNELEVNYNAIYRTEEELFEFFKKIDNVKLIEKSEIFKDLNDYEETSYEYFILKRGEEHE